MELGELAFYFQAQVFVKLLALTVLAFWVIFSSAHLISIAYAKYKLHRSAPAEGSGPSGSSSGPAAVPGVSIIKPLVGVEANLGPNLETFFTLRYAGDYELLFCLHSAKDPAGLVVESLLAKYPAVPAKIFAAPADVGVNPKINNMCPAYEAARHPLVLVSDSGIRMRPDTLTDMVAAMEEDVGLVSQMPFVEDGPASFPLALEKVFFGTWHARMYLAADLFRITCCSGMSCMVRRSLLDELGGLKAFGAYMAEDFFIAQGVRDKGFRLAVASQPAWQNAAQPTVRRLFGRISRWTKLRLTTLPSHLLVEPIQDCLVLGGLAAWATSFLLGWPPGLVFGVHCGVWVLLDRVLLGVVQGGPLPFGPLEFLAAWLLRETAAPLVLVWSLVSADVEWRESGTYRVDWGGRTRRVRDAKGRPVARELQYGPKARPSTTPPQTSIVIDAQPLDPPPSYASLSRSSESDSSHSTSHKRSPSFTNRPQQ